MKELIKIGELAKRTKTTSDTIRFYERRGIIRPHSRTNSGYRCYDKKAISALSFIKNAKNLGFSLEEIKTLLEIKVSKGGKCSLALDKMRTKEKDIDSRISDLRKIKRALGKLITQCKKNPGKENCHFLDFI
jgi:DNA-binding transcriptional MerR regulator